VDTELGEKPVTRADAAPLALDIWQLHLRKSRLSGPWPFRDMEKDRKPSGYDLQFLVRQIAARRRTNG